MFGLPTGQEGWGALFRAGTSDPCGGLFVWAARECPSCHQLEKTFIICVKSGREIESPHSVPVSQWISVFDQCTEKRASAARQKLYFSGILVL